MALVTALMLTLISMTIVMYLLLMVTSGIKQSGANKRYRTALEASYGGTEIMTKEVLPYIFLTTITNGGTNPGTAASGLFASALNFTAETDACLLQKLTSSTNWTACKSSSQLSDAKNAPDFTMKLNAASSTLNPSPDPFTVYAKIVNTECGDKRTYAAGGKCTNSDLSGIFLDAGIPTDMERKPAIYKIEIQAERSTNAQEKSKMAILYAY